MNPSTTQATTKTATTICPVTPPTYLVLDIETAPQRPELLRAAGWEPPRSYRAALPGETEDQRWHAWHAETAQLDPARSWVCAIGLYLPALGVSRLIWADDPGQEKSALATATQFLVGAIPFFVSECGEEENVVLDPASIVLVGHNIEAFDLPYLASRSLAHRIDEPLAVRDVIDTKKEWERRYHVRGAASSSLDCICRHLGLPVKPGRAQDFWTWPREKRHGYLSHDLAAPHRVAERMGLLPEPVPAAVEPAETVFIDDENKEPVPTGAPDSSVS